MQGKQGKRPRRVAPQGWPRRAAVVFIVTGQYKFSELSILAFIITQVNIYRHPIKLILAKQPFSPPILVFWGPQLRYGVCVAI